LFDKCAKERNNSSYTLSQTFLLQQVAYILIKSVLRKKQFKLYWLRAVKKTLTSLTKSTFNQQFTSQDSNNL